jgi:5-methyltetrahydrofolate corrinoid/iron sulfur protein methyltransferase
MRIKELLGLSDGRFPVLAEFVPLPGHDLNNFEKFLNGYAQKKSVLPEDMRLAGVTIPQSPNGLASLSPADVYSLIGMKNLWADLDVIPHVTAKDHNAEAVKSYLFGLRKLGLESVLALTGDKPSTGKGVFELDSIGLIELIREMNLESFQRAAPGGFDRVHQFFILAAVSPFKYSEASQRQQYDKMLKKLRVGANALITQMGWDWRKSEELFRYLGDERIQAPVFGNVYLLSTATPAPRLMYEGKLHGCLVTKDLFEKVAKESLTDHIERAAEQVAMYRDLGAAGVDIGGLWDFDTLLKIMNRAAEIGGGWRRFKDNLDFGLKTLPDGRPGYYLYDEGGRRREPSRPKKTFRKRSFDFMHRNLLTPGRAMNPALKKALGLSSSLRRGKGVPYKLFLAGEKALKTVLYDCEECGDCFLPDNFGRCTLGECEKGLPNPPCGDADPEGRCGHDTTRRCVGELIYDAAASEGMEGLKKWAKTINPGRIAALEGTASLLNYVFEKDHAKKIDLIRIGESLHASIARPAAAMSELLAKEADAFDRPSGALDYVISLIKDQIQHGADYLEVNVDAFGERNPDLTARMIRDYVRLIRKHGDGVPVCVDSGSPEVLIAGLEAWYEDAPPATPAPLLNSIKTYTMDRLFPLRAEYPFKFIGLLVDIHSTGSEGSYYGIDELHGMARTIFRTATGTHGFKPGDIFFDSTVFPLAIDMPMTPDTPGYTFRTFETIRKIKNDPELKGVHLSLGITNAVRDLPGRRTGVCRAYLAKAQEYGLDTAIVNVMHDYGKRPPAPDLVEFVGAFARQDGSAEAGQKVITAMMDFCRANRKIKDPACG